MKSALLGFILGLLFGPLGMLYSTVFGAIIMFLLGGFVVAATAGLALIVVLPICAFWAALACQSHNRRFMAAIRDAAETGARNAARGAGGSGTAAGAGSHAAPGASITGREGRGRVDMENPDMNSFL